MLEEEDKRFILELLEYNLTNAKNALKDAINGLSKGDRQSDSEEIISLRVEIKQLKRIIKTLCL